MPLLLHPLLFGKLSDVIPANVLFLSTVVTPESPPRVTVKIDPSQLIQASCQCLYVICLHAEEGIILEVFGHRPISNLLVL